VGSDCELGLILHAPADVAPRAQDPFLVIDGSLVVCALSARAEKLLGVLETRAINRPIGDFIVPADCEAGRPDSLVSAVMAAAFGEGEPQTVVVRPAGEYGVRLWVRVGPCGPPSAALLVLADARS
jgi:hypothetical protein